MNNINIQGLHFWTSIQDLRWNKGPKFRLLSKVEDQRRFQRGNTSFILSTVSATKSLDEVFRLFN